MYGILDLFTVNRENYLTNDQYNAIPSGNPMTTTDVCRNLDVDPKLYLKLPKLNKKLEHLAVELVAEIDKLVTDAYLNAELQKQRSEINSHLDNLFNDRTTQNEWINYITVTAKEEDSKIQ